MSEFDIIHNREEYKDIAVICKELEQASTNVEKAKLSREALCVIIKFIYQKESRKYPEKATLLELIDGVVISNFINEKLFLESLHFVRKLGIYARHELHITKRQADIAYNNIAFLVQYIVRKYEEPETVKEIVLPRYMSEAETRKIYIDSYLKEAGWEVVEPKKKTKFSDGTEHVSGTICPGKACCEIPVEGMNNKSKTGFCDYVLFGKDGKPLAIVEAKRTSERPEKGEEQVIQYGECMRQVCGYVPILYYTNGYEIYVIDGIYPARKIMAFHAIDELVYMLQNRKRNDITNIDINTKITDRYYQKMAITRVCEQFNEKHRRCLLVMATGTGKTRVAISLVDVLLKNKWIKNVLFLADRKSLVSQAAKNFKKYLENMTYCVLSDENKDRDLNARITFSTHQTMINYIDAEDKEYTCGHFDLIIVDEAHRSIFNKYGSIFKYFDCLFVGLTATPKEEIISDISSYKLFGCESGQPTYVYSLDEAVSDKYLVIPKLAKKTTKLLEQGILYSSLSEEDKLKVNSVLSDEDIEESYVIPKETLFKIFYNYDTCGKVLDDLMEHGLRVEDGQKLGKTIIFAYNHPHAEMIVKTFRRNYPKLGNDYCKLIDNKIKDAKRRIEKFEEEDDIRIAVSVDMLDTGIDVPSILNLVFFKPVKSKIKFVQMIGRGTRTCKKLIDGKDKEFFIIFDYCGNFDFFDKHPQGISNSNGKSLSQKLFDLRLDILVELQSYEHQTNEICKAYYDRLKPLLYEKVKEIKESSYRPAVREEMSYVDKYNDFEQWNVIAPLEKKEIQLHLSKLVENDNAQSKDALRFDMRMLQIELSVLVAGNISQSPKQVEYVRSIAKALLTYAASEPSVMAKAESLKAVVGNEFWDNPQLNKLEQYREDMRELLVYLKESVRPVDIDVTDMVIGEGFEDSPLIDIRTYKEKVIDYLGEHMDNETIRKIRNLEPITKDDLAELERILWHELGTQEEYHRTTNIDNLAAFIRSIIGVEQEVINKRFGEYLNNNVLNSVQQEFVKSIIDYVRENGDIQKEDLIDKSPFDNYDILELFGNNVSIVTKLVDEIHNCILAA